LYLQNKEYILSYIPHRYCKAGEGATGKAYYRSSALYHISYRLTDHKLSRRAGYYDPSHNFACGPFVSTTQLDFTYR